MKKIEWHRHNGILNIFLWRDEKRAFLYPTPVLRQDLSNYLDYPYRNKLAVSLVLMRRSITALRYTEALVKRACWFVKHLCERTDVRYQGVPIRLAITTDLYDTAMPYFEACNFPMSAVDWMHSQEAEYRQSTKMIAMKRLAFQSAERVLHMDLCYLIGTHASQYRCRLFRSIERLWTTQPFAMSHSLLLDKDKKNLIGDNAMQYWAREWDVEDPAAHPLWQTLAEYCDEPAEKLKNYWEDNFDAHHVSGGIFGFSREALDSMDLERDLFPIMSVANEEAALSAYAYKRNWSNEHCASINESFRWASVTQPVPEDVECRFCYTDEKTNWDVWLSQHTE